MIFITVGTHEQSFDRLIKEIDKIALDNEIKEKFYIQTGFSDYVPKNCQWSKFLSFTQMNELMKKADIIVTHGGPASFVAPLELGKIPIVVPRQKKFNEHINDHQLDFVRLIDKKNGNIIPVYNIKDLKKTIINYKKLANEKDSNLNSNNKKFNEKLSKIVNSLMNE
ncbi:PssE/Cps14G family polysaccharide biosynthesis glycosyltransferase [Limosilactobacillus pontis]|uniref:PssE/Cps14G family polysaccharide biosynthesis glycosyltransferase n=1 Tax=Limosilactobacillus pontis TaxID=35787 RepID=A0ABT7UZV7_9LACO|nr:PssE/Cps14G family polysaccharide biosynthesis glycosyltransferase [Limosilactobacillus pontis]MDM8267241.1 PssE/Cps14G family polysaccharide biosynthesis glycosyltransferase [Limosilactobacillus pontis]